LRELLARLGLKFPDDPGSSPPPDQKLLDELQVKILLKIQPEETPSLCMSTANEEIRKTLVTRLKEFPLSVRAQNVLAQLKILFVGELAQRNYHELLRLQGCGRHTIEELGTLLEANNLKFGTSIADWSREKAIEVEAQLSKAIAEQARERSHAHLKLIGPEPSCLEDELRRIVKAITNGRDTDLLIKLWGWNGEVYRTLESAGDEYRITRERVRQIEARALRRLKSTHFPTPYLRAAKGVLLKEAPAIDAELSKKISASGVSRNYFNVWSLARATGIFNERWPFERLDVGSKRVLILRNDVTHLRGALSVVRRKTSELGCTNILSLASELKIDHGGLTIVRKLLACASSVEWLDEAHEWFYLKSAPRNRLCNLCSKVLGVCPRIRISELRRAVGKSRRLPMVPPQKILGAFLDKTGLATIENETVIANSSVGSLPQKESAEGKMLEVLDAYGPVMDGEEFADRCVAAGMNAITFYIYRMNSPVISALGKGVYCKVGCEVPPGTIEDIVKRRKVVAHVSDHGWTSNGCLWFGIDLTRPIITAGAIRLAPFLRDLVQGEWKASLPDGTDFDEVTCRDAFIWSFRKAFAVLGAEPGDLGTFEFDLRSRKVLVRVGGPGLFEAIQDPDSVSAAESGDEI
jgi:hypothetical protein